jgi:iron complex transport system permease protein
VAVGAGVAVAGVIAFVALVVPTLARRVVGAAFRGVLVASALLGGTFLVLGDLAARGIVAPAEVPVGLVTAAVGGPFFLWLLWRGRAGVTR